MKSAIRTVGHFAAMLVMAVLSAIADPLLWALRKAMQATYITPNLPRLVKFAQHQWLKKGYGKAVAGGRSNGMSVGYAQIAVACIALVCMIGTAVAFMHGADGGGFLMASTAVAGSIDAKRSDLAKLLGELEAGQNEMKKGALSQTRGEELEAKAKEAEALQAEVERFDNRETLIRKGREVPNPTLPASPESSESKSNIAGYIGVGDYVLAAPEFKRFAATNYSRGSHAVVELEGVSLIGKNAVMGPRDQPMVPLTAVQRKAFEEFMQTKAAPTLGTGVLTVDRLVRIPQVTVDDVLTLRDVIATGQTGAGSVEYAREESHTQTAAETAHGVEKPEEALEYTLQTAPVRTIAAWMPVQNQQLEDWPQLRSLIEGRLRYSLKRREEYQILWGNNTGANLQGLFNVAGTTDIAENGRYDSGEHTLIDVIRMGITDVRVAGYSPNAVVVHPYDWEEIVLAKGSDNRYVWAVVTDANGTRMWGLRVVETVAAQARTAYANDERRVLVGDFAMGAQLLDRMQLTVMVGLIDRQLVENMRTLLVEERVALPIYAPAAFAHFTTQTAST